MADGTNIDLIPSNKLLIPKWSSTSGFNVDHSAQGKISISGSGKGSMTLGSPGTFRLQVIGEDSTGDQVSIFFKVSKTDHTTTTPQTNPNWAMFLVEPDSTKARLDVAYLYFRTQEEDLYLVMEHTDSSALIRCYVVRIAGGDF